MLKKKANLGGHTVKTLSDEEIKNIQIEKSLHDASITQLEKSIKKEGFYKNLSDDHIEKEFEKNVGKQKTHQQNLAKLFSRKETLDRVGYGFSSNQYIMIFLFLTGAPIFLVGLLNALRDVFTILISSFVHQYIEFKKIKNTFISSSGIIFGFSFLLMACAIKLQIIWLFSVAFLLGSISVVAYGELYSDLLTKSLKSEKRSYFLQWILKKGLLITTICFLISGIILEYFGLQGNTFTFSLFNNTYTFMLHGYLIVFEIAAFAFILSGYLLSKLPSLSTKKRIPTQHLFKEYLHTLKFHYHEFLVNKRVKLMLVSSTLVSVVQSLGAAYYGWYIYKMFENSFFGGFLNIAIIFGFALLVSFIGPSFANFFRKKLGLSPLFVFGTLLLAMLPLTLVYNPHFLTIFFANSFAVIGASILGVAQGLLSSNLLNDYERKIYFHSLGIASIFPFLIMVPLGALFGHFFGLELLFKLILIILILIVVPINFKLVMMSQKQKI